MQVYSRKKRGKNKNKQRNKNQKGSTHFMIYVSAYQTTLSTNSSMNHRKIPQIKFFKARKHC